MRTKFLFLIVASLLFASCGKENSVGRNGQNNGGPVNTNLNPQGDINFHSFQQGIANGSFDEVENASRVDHYFQKASYSGGSGGGFSFSYSFNFFGQSGSSSNGWNNGGHVVRKEEGSNVTNHFLGSNKSQIISGLVNITNGASNIQSCGHNCFDMTQGGYKYRIDLNYAIVANPIIRQNQSTFEIEVYDVYNSVAWYH